MKNPVIRVEKELGKIILGQGWLHCDTSSIWAILYTLWIL